MKNKNILMFIFLIIPFIEPLSFKDITWLDDMYSILKVFSFFIIGILYMLYLRRKEYNISKFIVLIFILFIFSIINIITMIFHDEFNYKELYSFLGMDNRYIFFLLPLCVFMILYSICYNDKLTKFSYLIVFISLFQVVYAWSVGAMITLILLIGYVLIFDYLKRMRDISLKTYFIIILIFNILLVFVQIQYYFEDFICKRF